VERECLRYGLRRDRLIASLEGRETLEISKQNRSRRNAFDLALVLGAIAIFVWLATTARRQPVAISPIPMAILTAATLALLVVGGLLLWQRTRFS